MVEVPREREHLTEPFGRAVTTSQMLERDLTRQTEPFGHSALTEYARTHATTEVSVVRMAALYYLADRESGRPAWSVPRFARQRGASSAGVEDALRALDGETITAIEEEAFIQGVSAPLLAGHALLYFLADADSGRLAGRVSETIDDEELGR